MRNFSNRRPGRRDSKPSFRDSGRFRDSNRPDRGDSKPSFRDSDRPERRASGRFRDDDRRDFRKPELEMHAAICDRCGNKCEVPFRPRGNKPVYCSDCFRKGENFKSDAPDKKEFSIINEKLDRILEALGKG